MVAIKDGEKNRTTISYARYLMSVKEGRILEDYEEVDHIDNDKSNDNIDNLQILSLDENKLKYATSSHIGVTMVKLKCPNCGRIFSKEKRNTHLDKKGKCTSCCRSCAGQFSAKIYYKKISEEEQEKLIGENVIEIYKQYNY